MISEVFSLYIAVLLLAGLRGGCPMLNKVCFQHRNGGSSKLFFFFGGEGGGVLP